MKKFTKKEAEKLWVMLQQKDEFTAGHCGRVAEMVEKFAKGLGWTSEEIDDLKNAALIHDLGKMDIPDEVFEKIRKGVKLEKEEIKTVRSHAGKTHLLESYSDVPPVVYDVLKYHHERFNGKGYPYKIGGKEIPEPVRMLSIADYFDTVAVQRKWKTPELQKPLDGDDGIKLIIDESVSRLDPELVVKFINIVLKNREIQN